MLFSAPGWGLQLIFIPEYSLVTILPLVLYMSLSILRLAKQNVRGNICSNEGLVNSPFLGASIHESYGSDLKIF